MSHAPPDQTPSDGENPSESVEQRLARQRREAALRLSTGDAPATPAEPASDKPGEAPYFEAKVSPIGGDIDSAGGRIMVWPDRLEVIDESWQHAGHAGANGTGFGTHFRVRIASPVFEGRSRVARHRLVYDALQDFIDGGVHALAVEIL